MSNKGEVKQSYADWVQSYNDAAKHGIEVDWDGGHAYHMTPYCYDQCKDSEAACDYDSNYLSNCDVELFCYPSFYHGGCCSGCYEHEENKVAYIKGFMESYTKQGYKFTPEEQDVFQKQIMAETIKLMRK